jgi:elongator complex protein 1
VEAAKAILAELKDESRNKTDLAGLFAFAGQFEEAVRIYLRAHDYKHAYKYLWEVSEQFREGELKDGFQLCWSVRRNELVRDRKDFLEKYQRLLKVHKHKAEFGEPAVWRARENDDMYSEVSVSSRSQSNYTMSTTTGMRKKKDKKRSILSRNVKEGSPLEEQYLLAYIGSLEEKVEDAVSKSILTQRTPSC